MPARPADTISPQLWRQLMQRIGKSDAANWDALLERLEAGDSGCIELHVKHGEVSSVRLRDWMLKQPC